MDTGYQRGVDIMEVTSIKAQIKSRQLQNFYIFAGTEWKIQRIYIEQIAKVAEKQLKYVDSIADIYSSITNRSFVQKSFVYVIRDDKELMTNEGLMAKLDTVLGDNILILLLTTVDKRLKFYKTYKDTICEFEPLKPEILKKYIQKEIQLNDRNCEKLMEICEYDYGRCLLEIDKIKQYVNYLGPAETQDAVLDKLLKEGVIYQPPKDAIFDFVDAILDRKINKAFELYQQCLAVGEAVMVMLTVLYSNAKAVYQVQTCQSKDVSKSTGLTGWQIMNAKKHLDKYPSSELLYIMDKCQGAQQGIVTGIIEESYVMEYIMTRVM